VIKKWTGQNKYINNNFKKKKINKQINKLSFIKPFFSTKLILSLVCALALQTLALVFLRTDAQKLLFLYYLV